jgi:hypothetical protein
VLFPTSAPGQIPLANLRHDFDAVNPPSSLWIRVNDAKFPQPVPMHYTFDTPVAAPPSQQCGRVLYDDFHVEDAMINGVTFPSECTGGTMTPQEKMLEFMIFDLGACVSLKVCQSSQTCAQQNVACGPAPDGCGNILQCGSCPAGLFCVGGQCTAGCTPRTCAQQGLSCGAQSDGCSGALQCGACPTNEVCLDGTCSPGICQPRTCAEQGFACGPQGDGCGHLLSCGTCPAGRLCAAGRCFAPDCTPRTCAEQGFDCGLASDGCNQIIDCGTCPAGSVCGGGSTARPNVCG